MEHSQKLELPSPAWARCGEQIPSGLCRHRKLLDRPRSAGDSARQEQLTQGKTWFDAEELS